MIGRIYIQERVPMFDVVSVRMPLVQTHILVKYQPDFIKISGKIQTYPEMFEPPFIKGSE